MRGIPVPFGEVPKTATHLGRVQPSRGPQSRGDASGFVKSAGDAALINARGFVVSEQSVGQTGQAVEQEGHAMAALRIKANEAVGIRHEQEADDAMEAAKIAISTDIAREPDETKWLGLADKQIKTASDKVLAGNYSPDTRERISLKLQGWQARMRAVTDQHAAETSINRGVQIRRQQLDVARQQQDPERFEATLAELKKFGGITDAGIELERIQYAETGRQLQREAKAERFNVAQNLAIARTRALGEDAALQELRNGNFGELDPSDKERIRGSINQTARNDFADAQADLLDGMATGKIQTDADIDIAAPKTFRPSDRQLLKDKLKKELSEAAKLQAAKPAVIRERFGKLLDAVHQFDPEAMGREEATNAFVSIGIESLLLPENLRNDITGPLDKKWRGTMELDTSVKGYIVQAVQDLYDNGGFAPISKWVEVVRPDGITKVWEKQPDVEGQKKARALMADARKALDDWADKNPNATREEATQAIYTLSGQSMRMDDAASILSTANAVTLPGSSPPAGFPSMDVFSSVAGSLGAGFKGGRITSYGYPDDPTPDSNSAAGIGAFVPEAEQAKIKRGEASDYKLKAGDIAVSPDVEAAFMRSNIRPGDTVTLTYEDGTKHTGRWMDRTAKEYKGKALKGRFDLYSPTGKHARDGQPVISFTRN